MINQTIRHIVLITAVLVVKIDATSYPYGAAAMEPIQAHSSDVTNCCVVSERCPRPRHGQCRATCKPCSQVCKMRGCCPKCAYCPKAKEVVCPVARPICYNSPRVRCCRTRINYLPRPLRCCPKPVTYSPLAGVCQVPEPVFPAEPAPTCRLAQSKCATIITPSMVRFEQPAKPSADEMFYAHVENAVYKEPLRRAAPQDPQSGEVKEEVA